MLFYGVHNARDRERGACSSRAKVLISEAVEAPQIGPNCRLTGGRWFSYYDATSVTSAAGLDIDHMVPLAEAWDSGASAWTARRREAYANDQGAEASLVAVTARSNRSKSNQDPATWLPPAPDTAVRCTYAAQWVATKLRWDLTVDDTELAALPSSTTTRSWSSRSSPGSRFWTGAIAPPRRRRPPAGQQG
ncbi:HNH endonuclease family protein [Streptomyces beigongshangae]|uniref:HNH endonuclease family protein n=1 Tax=Streptomyces beigongshangae TaxID=2841597 RepID=UPI0027DFECAC|nr:HNH endonuclease family protein [Streptomyces sp. REN17]